jgi:hypothetical protein
MPIIKTSVKGQRVIPINVACGFLKGKKSLSKELIKERKKEDRHEKKNN